jgi:hypothetical protein
VANQRVLDLRNFRHFTPERSRSVTACRDRSSVCGDARAETERPVRVITRVAGRQVQHLRSSDLHYPPLRNGNTLYHLVLDRTTLQLSSLDREYVACHQLTYFSRQPAGDKTIRISVQSASDRGQPCADPHTRPLGSRVPARDPRLPHGPHDDQIDSLSQFMGWIFRRRIPLQIF